MSIKSWKPKKQFLNCQPVLMNLPMPASYVSGVIADVLPVANAYIPLSVLTGYYSACSKRQQNYHFKM